MPKNVNYENYDDLGDAGVAKEQVAPEDEFLHSVYIGGQLRKNQTGITEQPGLLHVRGVEYNKTTVYGIILHVKQVLCKQHRTQGGKEHIDCFSYQEGAQPYRGTSGITCGANSAERATNSYCINCRAQIIISLIQTDENGKPLLTKDKKLIFIFIRGKGSKYGNISDYLSKMSQLDLEPVFEPVTEKSKNFEKRVVNNKRFVTKITVGKTPTSFGDKQVFVLENGTKISEKNTLDILEIAKKTIEKFNEKMNWAKNRQGSTPVVATENQIPNVPAQTNETSQLKSETSTQQQVSEDPVDFSDISLDF